MSSDLVPFSDGPLVPPLQQPLPQPIEGTDQSLATVILPAPPPMGFIKLPMNKRPGDHAKRPLPSFIPSSDPGTTYATLGSGLAPMTVGGNAGPDAGADADHARRKRARAEKTSLLAPVSRGARSSGYHTPVEDPAMSSPLRHDTLLDGSAVPSVDNPSHPAPSTLRPQLPDSSEFFTDVLPPLGASTSSSSSQQPPAKRPRGRPRKVALPFGGNLVDLAGSSKSQAAPPPPSAPPLPSAPAPVSSLPAGAAPFRNDDICACCLIPHSESDSSPLSHFLYCDGCTRSFHMGCLDPPIVDDADLPPSEKEWFCPSCLAERAPVPRLPPDPGPFDFLNQALESSIPRAFSLPEDVRGFFKDVGIGPQGTFVNTGEMKPGKANRQGFLEDRDPTRIRDRNNNLIICHRCKKTALPRTQLVSETSSPSPGLGLDGIADPSSSTSTARPERKAKLAADLALQATRIISCDYCSLHWHLDCLDPPMVTMPSPLKKWMCPNHIEHVMPKRRTPKVQKIVEVTQRHQPNNGFIDIIPSADDPGLQRDGTYEEVWINSKKYMIPERVVRLDFLDKVHALKHPEENDSRWRETVLRHLTDASSRSTSPLTSLSSSSVDGDEDETEDDDEPSSRRARAEKELEELYAKSEAALALLTLPERRHPQPQSQITPSSSAHRLEDLIKAALADLPAPPESKPNSVDPTSNGGISLKPSTPPPVVPKAEPASTPTPAPVSSPSTLATFGPPVKAGSTATSFRIRLNRPSTNGAPISNGSNGTIPAAASSSLVQSTSAMSVDSVPTPSVSVKQEHPVTANGNVNGNGAAHRSPSPDEELESSPSSTLSLAEIQQLIQVRALMQAKGERRMMEWLTSAEE